MTVRKGLGQANILRTNNNTSTGYGVVYADEVSGHRTVANLTALCALNDWQLSASGDNTNSDAVGQLWYVVDADGKENGALYQLKDWSKRKEVAGWSEFKGTGGEVDLSGYATTSAVADAVSAEQTRAKGVEETILGKVDELEGKIQEDEDGTLKVVDEGGNIAFKVDGNGANARKFNLCDENGSIVGTIDFEVFTSLLAKQDKLVSGENIATINGETILDGKDIKVEGGIKDDGIPELNIVDENKNVVFGINADGVSAARYNVKDENGHIVGVIDGSLFGGVHKDDIMVDEDYNVDGEAVKAKVFAIRETWRNKYVTSSSKTIYWDNIDGLDTNNGTTSSTPVLTFAKVKELLADGDTLLIKRGSRITSVCDFGALNGIKIDIYGNISLPNPIFDNFVELTGWEKVSGYTNIYRAKRQYPASPNVQFKTYYMQCFVDGKRLGSNITSDKSLANKVSGMNFKTQAEALAYLDAHPDDACWFGGFERILDEPSWTSGEYYWYISLSDAPSNHMIEVSNNVAISLCNIEECKFTDIRNIDHRGGVGKDGWHIGRNTIMENCNSYDQPNYGMLLQGGSWYCINCKIVSKSGSVSTQFHYFGDNPTYDYGSEYAFIGCSVILDRNNVMGSQGFGGHYTDAHTQLVTKNIYVIDCRCEGVWRCVAGYKSKCFYVKNLEMVDCEAVYSANNIVIDGVKGNIKANGTTFVYIDNVSLNSMKVRGAVIKYENGSTQTDNGFIAVNQSVASVNNCPLNATFKDCKFIFEKTKGSAYNFIIPNASDMTFENCCFAVKSNTNQYITNTPSVDNIHFDDCSFFGIENNITFEDSVNKCTFGNVGEMGSNFSFVDKNIVKQLKF